MALGGFPGALANLGQISLGMQAQQQAAQAMALNRLKTHAAALQLQQEARQQQWQNEQLDALRKLGQQPGGLAGELQALQQGGIPQPQPTGFQMGAAQDLTSAAKQPHSLLPPVPNATAAMGAPLRSSWFGNYTSPTGVAWRDATDSSLQASGRPVSAGPGIALPTRATLGQQFYVTAPNGRTLELRQTDIGPAKYTGRGVDINAPAAEAFGYSPNNFPTDQQFRVTPVGTALGASPQETQQGASVASATARTISPTLIGRVDPTQLLRRIEHVAPKQHRHLFPTDRPITAQSGRELAAWCAGGMPVKIDAEPPAEPADEQLLEEAWESRPPWH